MREKLVHNEGWWIVFVICRHHNHELIDILICHPYDIKLKPNEQSMLVDIKATNILLNLKENNLDNTITIKQVYNVKDAQS